MGLQALSEKEPVPCSFVSLMGLHRELDELFLQHQEALLSLDIDQAIERLRVYEGKLLPHMRDEEERLLPVYAARAGRILGGPVEFFLGEHRKMREFLDSFHADLERMREEPLAVRRRSVIALMDHQAMYKHLVEHHDLREKNILYPQLDRVTSEGERLELLQECQHAETAQGGS